MAYHVLFIIEALQILCAVLLTPEKVTISNIPDIIDVNKLIDLLKSLGVKIEKKSESTCEFKADNVNVDYLLTEEYKKKAVLSMILDQKGLFY